MGDQCAAARRARGSRKAPSQSSAPEPPRSHSAAAKPPARGGGRAGAGRGDARPPGEHAKAINPRDSPSPTDPKGATPARSRTEKGPAPSEMGSVHNGKGSAPGESNAVPSRKGAVPTRKDSARREKGAVPKTKESPARGPPAVASYCCTGAESSVGVKSGGVGARRLRDVLKTLSLGRQDTSEASENVNQLIRTLVSAIRARESSFSSIDILGTGSYYEHVKISAPNEFDIMFTMPAPRVELEQCDGSGAFYYVRLKRNPQGNDLDKFLQEDGTLAACKMLFALRNIIKEIVKSMTRTEMKVTVDKKKAGSPAITLRIGNPPMEISVDIILALEVRSQSWPASTQEGLKIEKWLGSKVKQEYKWKPIYLVPKHAKDGRVLKEDTWRLSFSHIEKEMIKNHGNTKTCCESKGVKCCRKSCLKLLKHLLDQLKTKDGNRRGLDKFCSYHAKTAFFQACVLWPDDKQWLFTDLESCFQNFLDYFLDCLNNAYLPHFFIPTHNLFSRQLIDKASSDFLSKEIKYEINNRFPIFELQN
ncbi:cyclic GMP-AMP synthase [Terrapene carolina triunguis]|uniref:cyclic GMP-AMP synthase n=1 Tax=Terrapene triunguis TaxID=2587831 RepID=UPI000CEFA78E|nr:cyclic GMP-AMP synthase [Terrapene carolina triunguis]